MEAILESIFGVYQPVTYSVAGADGTVSEVVAAGAAGVDWTGHDDGSGHTRGIMSGLRPHPSTQNFVSQGPGSKKQVNQCEHWITCFFSTLYTLDRQRYCALHGRQPKSPPAIPVDRHF